MLNFLKKYKIVIILFGVALIFRLFFFCLMALDYGPGSFYLANDGQSLTDNDSQHYVLIAKNLVENGVYSRFIDQPLQLDSYRTPLLPFYFAPFVYFFGFGSIWLAILFLDIILSLTVIVVYFLARLFVSSRSAFVVGLVTALEPLLAYRSNIAEPDALMILFFITSLYFLVRWWRGLQWRYLAWSVITLGLMTLAKPAGLYILFLFLFFILVRLCFRQVTWKKIVLAASFYFVIFIVIIFPWLYRNHQVFGVWDLSSVSAYNLYAYYTSSFQLPAEQVNFSADVREPVRNLRYQKQLLDVSWARINAQPLQYWTYHLIGTARSLFVSDLPPFFYNGHSKLLPFSYNPINGVNITQGILSGHTNTSLKFIFQPVNFLLILRYILLALFYLLVLISWAKSFKRDKKYFVAFTLFLALTFYFVFTPGPFVDPKYRLPAIPLLLIMFFYLFERSPKENHKIVIAADIFSPDIGGPATYSQKIASALKTAGWQVKLVCYSDHKQKDDYNFPVFRVVRSRLALWHYLKYFLILFWLAKDTDIVYAMGPVSAGWPALVAAKVLGKKFVVKVVGDYAWEQARNLKVTDLGIDAFQPDKLSGKIGQLKKIESRVCQKADKVIVPSNYLKQIVSGWKVNENKIDVIYNATTLPPVTLNATTAARQNSLIVSVGRLVPWKGFVTLIEMMTDLLQENENFILMIYGSGPQEKELRALIKQLALETKVFISSVSRDRLLIDLCSAGIFVLNTGYEGLPHSILEAMACDVPVITTNICGNPEVIQDGYNGLLVEYDNKEQIENAILRLYREPELRAKFVQNSKEVLKKFVFKEMISKTENLLKNL